MSKNAKYRAAVNYYKKRYKKKGYGKYKFSKYSTFKNRSSVAQANQIYTLNKKLNHYVKSTKPEIQTKEFNAITDFGYDSYTTVVNQSTDAMMWCVTPASVFTTFNGKLCRVKSISVRGFVSTAYNSGYPTICRFIFFTNRETKGILPLPSEIVNYNTGDNTDYEKGPLKTGVTSDYKILLDRSVVMSPSFYRSRSFKFNLRNFLNFRTSTAFRDITPGGSPSVQVYPKGTVYCLTLFSNHGYSTNSTSSYPAITLKDFRVKMSYVDQN